MATHRAGQFVIGDGRGVPRHMIRTACEECGAYWPCPTVGLVINELARTAIELIACSADCPVPSAGPMVGHNPACRNRRPERRAVRSECADILYARAEQIDKEGLEA